MLTLQQKEEIRNLIRNADDPNGIKTAKLPGMLNELGIDWHEHQQDDEKFLAWLKRELPEFKIGGHCVTLPSTGAAPAITESICRQAVEIV